MKCSQKEKGESKSVQSMKDKEKSLLFPRMILRFSKLFDKDV